MLKDNAILVFTDGAMDRDSNRTGGTGFVIKFPHFVGIPDIQESSRRDGQGIHRLEMIAILEALEWLNKWLKKNGELIHNVSSVVINTDRISLTETELLNPWKIADWRRMGWENHEGKPIKDHDLLDEIDKNRTKLSKGIRGRVEIKYLRRKHNKEADKLSKLGKKGLAKSRIILGGKESKIAPRLFDGEEIKYSDLSVGDCLDVRVYMKDPVQKQFEVVGEINEGKHLGKKIRIYVSPIEELELHRHHCYRFTVKEVHKYHIRVMPGFKEIEAD